VGLYSAFDRLRPVDEGGSRSDYYRTEFRRDYGRLVHCGALRRLQGKTQLFPGFESDFFRNRLTHSLEVAQVAKSIALELNKSVSELRDDPIDVDIVEFAGLAHDLGHAPFGHNGESALDACMKSFGGFEGNAQTLRIITRLEKKRLRGDAPGSAQAFGIDPAGNDYRAGVNPTARTIAAILKYDHEIERSRAAGSPLSKGYYASDAEVVAFTKENVLGPKCKTRTLKTIECQIMDLADDIAYSTYDLEDTFKAGFLNPLDLISLTPEFRERVAGAVSKAIPGFTADDVRDELIGMFQTLVSAGSGDEPLASAIAAYQSAKETASIGYARTALTAEMVGEFVEGVEFVFDPNCPPLSIARLGGATLRRVETLKHVTYEATIKSSRLKIAEYRGKEIVNTIFAALSGTDGDALLPDDFREQFERLVGEENKKRLICDYIAGMTDAYAIEFYARLTSENARTIFRPL